MKLAVAQFEHREGIRDNLSEVRKLVSEAQAGGVDLICFGEWFIGQSEVAPIPNPLTDELVELAKGSGVTIITGNIYAKTPLLQSRQLSLVIDPGEGIIGQQEKLAMYEWEGKTTLPGRDLYSFKTGFGKVCILNGPPACDVVWHTRVLHIHPSILVLQHSFRSEEELKAVKDILVGLSGSIARTVVLAPLLGSFSNRHFIGGAFIAHEGKLVAEGGRLIAFDTSSLRGEGYSAEGAPALFPRRGEAQPVILGPPRDESYILGIIGSDARNDEDAVGLMERGALGAKKIFRNEIVHLGKIQLQSCRHCGECRKLGRCVVDDDFQRVFAKMRIATALFIVVYLREELSRETRLFLRRMLNINATNPILKGKDCSMIGLCDLVDDEDTVADILEAFAKNCGMTIIDLQIFYRGTGITYLERKMAFKMGEELSKAVLRRIREEKRNARGLRDVGVDKIS
ncbi:MAG: nitrilase-related carbon-nitrogen hydrolase [bacterium]